MGTSRGPQENGAANDASQKIITHPLYARRQWPWLDIKVFYVRISNCEVDESSPGHLRLNCIPLSPDTVIEVNGKRSSIYSESLISSLRRDRVDKKSEEATFVSTDRMRVSGNARFQVLHKDNLLIVGDMEMCNPSGSVGETISDSKKWTMNCKAEPSCNLFMRGKACSRSKCSPMIEVYVAGSSANTPIILTNTIHLILSKRLPKVVLHAIPEDDTAEQEKDAACQDSRKVLDTNEFKHEMDVDIDYNSLYSRANTEGEDGDLSWFNAGVRVGVGIGLGICVGVGIGIGLLVQTYQSTSRTFRRRPI